MMQDLCHCLFYIAKSIFWFWSCGISIFDILKVYNIECFIFLHTVQFWPQFGHLSQILWILKDSTDPRLKSESLIVSLTCWPYFTSDKILALSEDLTHSPAVCLLLRQPSNQKTIEQWFPTMFLEDAQHCTSCMSFVWHTRYRYRSLY